jgi:Fe-S-cluster containining protein
VPIEIRTLMSPSRDKFDCLSCGACCFQRAGTILVAESDIENWRDRRRLDIVEQLEPGHFGFMAFKMTAAGSCVFHGTSEHPHACAIYEVRADVCRDFEQGSAQCREFRRDRGVL